MNLIPLEVKQKRQRKEMIQKGAFASLVPVVIVAQAYYSMYSMKNEIADLKLNIDQATQLESQITNEQNTIEKNRSIIVNLTSGGLPLNQFLLFTGLHMPDDMRLYSITSESIIEEEMEKEEMPEGTVPVPEVAPEVAPEGEVPPVEEGGAVPPVELTPIENKSNKIIIKGAGLDVKSIGTFMSELENKNEYIANVDIVDVQNYYNGAFNYKFFELIIELKN